MKKFFLPIFSRIIDYKKPQRTHYRGLQGFVTVIMQVIRSFLWDPRGRWKQVLKIGYFPEKKTTLADFLPYYRERQTTSNILSDSTRYYDSRCASYMNISETSKRLLKTQVFEKKLFFRRKNYFGRFFVILPSLKSLRKQLLRVHVVFWQLLCKL